MHGPPGGTPGGPCFLGLSQALTILRPVSVPAPSALICLRAAPASSPGRDGADHLGSGSCQEPHSFIICASQKEPSRRVRSNMPRHMPTLNDLCPLAIYLSEITFGTDE